MEKTAGQLRRDGGFLRAVRSGIEDGVERQASAGRAPDPDLDQGGGERGGE